MAGAGRIRRRARALLVAACVMVAAGCSSGEDGAAPTTTAPSAEPTGASGPSAGCDASPVAVPGITERTLESGGIERSYQLDVPEGYDGTAPFPVVLGLHALSISHTMVSPGGGLTEGRATDDYILVAPSGRVNGATPFWDATAAEDNADVQFIADLLDHLEATLCVDTGRVYATGMSNGAQMSSILACRLPDRIAAIAGIAGIEFPAPCEGPPVGVLAFHGTADPIVTYEGGGLNARTIAAQNLYHDDVPPEVSSALGVDESMARWADHNGCEGDPVDEVITAEVTRRSWPGCEAPTVLYVIEGGGHTWPGRPFPQLEDVFGPTTVDVEATPLLFRFFFEGTDAP